VHDEDGNRETTRKEAQEGREDMKGGGRKEG